MELLFMIKTIKNQVRKDGWVGSMENPLQTWWRSGRSGKGQLIMTWRLRRIETWEEGSRQ